MSTDTLSNNSNSTVDAYDAAAQFPSYSVLMSVYEKENPSYLEEALLSTLNQSISPEEIVLVEDGPLTSELNETIDSFSSARPELFTIIAYPENHGLGYALERGVPACRNEIIARMV